VLSFVAKGEAHHGTSPRLVLSGQYAPQAITLAADQQLFADDSAPRVALASREIADAWSQLTEFEHSALLDAVYCQGMVRLRWCRC
jgi:hypothetical protein